MRSLTTIITVLVCFAVASIVSPGLNAGAWVAPTCDGRLATKILTAPGTFLGGPGDDVVIGSSGNDLIKGNGGNDAICGGPGDDTLYGGSGDDALFGEGGSDAVYADKGNDYIEGDDLSDYSDWGNDVLDGGSGIDAILDYSGDNLMDGGPDADYVYGTGTALGGSGDDITVYALYDFLNLCGGCHDAYANGGSGSDDQVGVSGSLTEGGSGNDWVAADGDGDEVHGGSGRDYLQAFNTNVTLNGGSAYDTCVTTGHSGVITISCEIVS